MKVKRIVASVGASVEQFISKMENHEAVAKCVIDDIRQSAARIRGEINRVRARLEKLERDAESLDREKQQWHERAKRCIAQQNNEARALECMRQAKDLDKRIEQLVSQRAQSENLLASLNKNLHEVEHKLEHLESKRAVLSSREARANVAHTLNNGDIATDPLQVFERWESEVMTQEYADSAVVFGDETHCKDSQLEREFNKEEEDAALQHALSQLKQELDSSSASGDKKQGGNNQGDNNQGDNNQGEKHE